MVTSVSIVIEKEINSMFLPSFSPNHIKLGLKFNCHGYGLSTVDYGQF